MKSIIDYIPQELNKIVDYQEIAKAIEEYANVIYEEIENAKKNLDVFEMDEEHIAKMEKRCSITPSATATLEERRYAVWIKMLLKVPYTEQWVRKWLNNLLGNNNYVLEMDYEHYGALLKMSLRDEKMFDAVATLFDSIVPCHILYIISYLFNTWQDAYERYDWETGHEWTWEDAYKNELF